jgi:hypothetical protein
MIDHVEYRSAAPPDGGLVRIIVHAVGFGDLEPRPSKLPRTPRLQFAAEGKANGAFKIELFLIDLQNRYYEPTVLRTPCD